MHKGTRITPVILIIFSAIFYCCSSKENITVDGMIEYVENEDNTLINKVKYEIFIFSIQYDPLEIIALRGSNSIEEFKLNYPSNIEPYNELEYYTFKISSENKSTRHALSALYDGTPEELTSYIDFIIQNDIKLVQGDDSLSCSYLHKEVSEAITNELSYSIGFVKTAIKNIDRKIILKSNFQEIPDINFIITEKSIQSVPPLKI